MSIYYPFDRVLTSRVCCPSLADSTELSDRPEGTLLPTHTHLCHLLTGSAAILIMVRGLWALPLEGQSPPGATGTLVTCPVALTAPPARPQLCVVMIFVIYLSIISPAMSHVGNPCS